MPFDIQTLFIFSYVLDFLQIALLTRYLWRRQLPQPVPPSTLQSTDPQNRSFGASSAAGADAATDAKDASCATSDDLQVSQTAVGHACLLTPEELVKARERIAYQEDLFHFVIVGGYMSGKSSLVNAFRGMRDNDDGAAYVHDIMLEEFISSTPSRFPDPNPGRPYVWFEIRGGFSLNVTGSLGLFRELALYIFDAVLINASNPVTLLNTIILANCHRFNIPTYIVQSKADEHIHTIMEEMGYDEDTATDEEHDRLYQAARKKFVEETRRSAQATLKAAGLPEQRVYIISCDTLRQVVQKKAPDTKDVIDELELCRDLFATRIARRIAMQVPDSKIVGA